MFFKKFDLISPSITLYFKGNNIHSSIFSGILTILAYIIILIFGINYLLEFINKKSPTAFFFNRFIEDAGVFPLNASSMFHYIQFKKTLDKETSPIDFNMVRIIGIQDITIDNYPYVNLENIPHWLYDFCNNDTDTKNIGYLITSEEFSKCACIRQYYDNVKKQYFNTNNNNFKWPSIEHGMSSKNPTYYGIIIEKCKNDNLRTISGKASCENNEKIDNYIFSQVISIYLIDHYSDVLNYKKPFTKYLYSISNMLFPKYFTVNNINFNPSIIKTNNGIILDNTVEELSYFFSQNEKVTMDEEIEITDEEGNELYNENDNKLYKSTGIVSSYYFWMQNRLQYYERNYKKLQDILSNIGGLSRIVLLVAIFINKLVYHYIILLDTEDLALSLEQKEKLKSTTRSTTVYKKLNVLINPPKRKYLSHKLNNNILQSSNMQRFIKEDIHISKKTNINYESTDNNKNIKNNNLINIYNYNNKENNEIDNNIIEKIKIKESRKDNNKRRYKKREKNNNFLEKKDLNNLNQLSIEQREKEEIFNIPTENKILVGLYILNI